MRTKRYEDLRFIDDFMFCKILENNPDICRQLIEIILGIKVKNIVYTDKQSVLDITAGGKSIRLDVYCDDGKGTVYDLEMQTTDNSNLPKRSRYYQGMIDLNTIEKGADYKGLKESYVIFLCTFDPFGKNLPVYTFSNFCEQIPSLCLEDKAKKVFVNTSCSCQNIPKELDGFFKYIKTGDASLSDLAEKIDKEVQSAILHREWRMEFMTLEMLQKERFAEGKIEGKIEGSIETLLDLGMDDEEIIFHIHAKYPDLQIGQIKDLISKIKEDD